MLLSVYIADVKFWCSDPERHSAYSIYVIIVKFTYLTVVSKAEGGLHDPHYMIVRMTNGTRRKVSISDSLKNSSTLQDWIDHEKRVNEIVTSIRSMEIDSQNLNSKMPVLWTDMIHFCLKHWASTDELQKEFELNLPMMKEKYQNDRQEALTKLNLEFKERFKQ